MVCLPFNSSHHETATIRIFRTLEKEQEAIKSATVLKRLSTNIKEKRCEILQVVES